MEFYIIRICEIAANLTLLESKMKSKYIEENELDLLQSALSEEEFLPLAVSLETGLRIGDVVKLKHSDIKGGYLYFIAEKTGKAGRAKISRALAIELRKPNGSNWCFPGRDPRNHLTRQAVWHRVKRACAARGLEADGISPHAMRKVFAVECAKNEGAEAAKRALQHTDLQTTDLYILSDWTTGKKAQEPLRRCDIPRIVEEIYRILKMNVDKL